MARNAWITGVPARIMPSRTTASGKSGLTCQQRAIHIITENVEGVQRLAIRQPTDEPRQIGDAGFVGAEVYVDVLDFTFMRPAQHHGRLAEIGVAGPRESQRGAERAGIAQRLPPSGGPVRAERFGRRFDDVLRDVVHRGLHAADRFVESSVAGLLQRGNADFHALAFEFEDLVDHEGLAETRIHAQ